MSTEKQVVLVSENDEVLRDTLHDVLTESGYLSIGIESLSDLRAALEAHPGAVLLLDTRLDSDSPAQWLESLVADKTAPPTILVSGSAKASAIAQRFHVAHLPKPFDIEDLVARLRELLRTPSLPHDESDPAGDAKG